MKKFSAKKRILICLLFIVIILSIIKFIPMLYCYYTKFYSEGKKFLGNKEITVAEVEELLNYNITNLINSIANTNVKINYESEQDCVYTNFVKISITNLHKDKNYRMEYTINDGKIKVEEIKERNENYETKINLQEGKNKVYIVIKEDTDILKEEEKEIFYIKPYEKQFLDEIESNGVQVHYKKPDLENCESDIKQLKNLGVNYVRAGFTWELIEKEKGKYDFSYYDTWMSKLKENDIKVIANIGTNSTKYIGSDRKFSSEDEIAQFMKFITAVQEHYSYIEDYEILNEPNYNSYGYLYKTEEQVKWYYKLAEETQKTLLNKNPNLNINIGSLSIDRVETKNNISPVNFINIIKEDLYKNFDKISIHPYDWFNYTTPNLTLKKNMKPIETLFNDIGGFFVINATEYGATSYNELDLNEETQAGKLVQQSVLLDSYNMNNKIIYNFWNMGTDIKQREDNFGLITNDYKPKLAYYAVKKCYENINGAEYIGSINLDEGLEAHIYDKDGKPKMITWSNTKGKTVEIKYNNFTAKDIYGNEIKNENGELTITTSPIYLDNIEEKYFYQAISNTATTKYTEFEEKFAEEIEKLPEIKQQTKNLKQQIEQIGKTETRIDEQTAKTLMQRHFQLGNSLINAYQNRRIETEKVKLSSMLDMLNDIGNSYEDLVTVTAKTRNADISQAKDLVKEVENIITSNSDIEIIYPAKILEFSKDYQEKAEYINGLEEENDIKTGLIVSKNLHSIYLSNWAKEFTNIYIDEYLKNNLIAENYSEKNITNQDVTVTLNIGDDTKITNNNGSNQYTFTENGEYTFEYERRGRKFRQTVKVENIDKQSPKITGVEEGQVYENKIKPIIEDENLETVRLIQDGRMIDNYINNAEIKEEGMYRIEAIDKAGNKTITSFEIIENISKEYIIENNIIKNIEANTTVEQFKENIKIQTEYNIQREGQTLEAKEKIATGDILQIGDTQYTLIVRGDIDKDSKITIKDLILLRQQIIGEKTLEDTAKTAGDIDLNKKIDARDIVKLRKLILTNNQ